ncbi:MAG: peptidoglycan bridge formation glycyltransferase FemA/FemB family protein [Treponema sp.]|jgi:lipid II:glycine glycyltransferase (peptidoglycan interpeptide bridge formation enzyme)|nr:peptidoglycan bridge formation glycyltransferase FemA/FemB family protein [Treponema sp.]
MDPYLISLRPAELSVCTAAASFLQTDFWGGFKGRFGWAALAFTAEWLTGTAAAGLPPAGGPPQSGGETAVLPLLVLHRRLGPALSFAYVPWGPELPAGYDAAARNVSAARLAAVLRGLLPRDTAFIRFDFPWYCETTPALAPEPVPPVSSAGRAAAGECSPPEKPFRRAAANVQPPDSVLVNLAPGEPAILGAMKPKWRYNVGLAEKKGVQVRIAGSSSPVRQELETFYGMYRETAARDGIAIHGIGYYAALFEEAAKYVLPPGCRPDTRLYIASHEGEDIAGIITLFRGREAVYLYGASANRKRNLMAPYALQWRAMRDAKTAGCVYYDLFGIPPEDPDINPHHPMAGLYRFKTGFIGGGEGGVIIHRPGSWDYPCRPLAWALYSAAEKARKKIRDMRKKKPRP